jgi:hypothetical protein
MGSCTSMKRFVYTSKSALASYVKLGRTNNPYSRYAALKTTMPQNTMKVFYHPRGGDIETLAKRWFKPEQVC